MEERLRLLDALKTKAKKGYARLAFELHPDKTGNDPEKTAQFRLLTEVRADIDALEADRIPEPVPEVRVAPVVVRPPVRRTGYFSQALQQAPIKVDPYTQARIIASMRPKRTS